MAAERDSNLVHQMDSFPYFRGLQDRGITLYISDWIHIRLSYLAFLTLFLWALSKPHSWAAAVLVGELRVGRIPTRAGAMICAWSETRGQNPLLSFFVSKNNPRLWVLTGGLK